MTPPAVGEQRSAVGGWRLGVYGLASSAVLPAAAAWAASRPRTRAHWRERVGWTLPVVEPGALWLHAASLGEGQAAAALAAGASERWPELPLLRTATSDTGRRQPLPVDDVRCLPFDVPCLHRRVLRRARPRAVVLVEGELWPGLLAACRGRAPVAVTGLRVGEGTRRFAARFPGLWRETLACVHSWSARDSDSAAFLGDWLRRDIPVVGELKAEAPIEPSLLRFARSLLVAGSTRPGDEGALLGALATLEPRPQLVLAPRHAERFGEVAALLDRSGSSWARRSQLEGVDVPAELDVLLLDSVGELAGLYARASVAFVGGTFDPAIGGHSAAEAARAGVAVVHGPETHANAPSFAVARCVRASSHTELGPSLAAALELPRPMPVVGEAVAKALDLLEPLATASVPGETSHRPWAKLLVPCYRLAAAWRARRARRTAPCPVISVGNLASGGTGKTPVVRWLYRALEERGLRVAVVSRGHGRVARGPFLRDGGPGQASAALLGDELAILAGDGALVVSCPDRHRAATRAVELGAQLCLLDDGFQQRDLDVDRDVVVLDARHPTAGGLLPAGEARERLEALSRADLVWVNHGEVSPSIVEAAGTAPRVSARMVPVGWLRAGEHVPLEAGPTGRVVALACVAKPEGFLRTLRRLGMVPVQRLLYPDHHRFTPADIARIAASGGLPVVTTEKDLVRLPEHLDAWALRVRLQPQQGEDGLEAWLDAFVSQHNLRGRS